MKNYRVLLLLGVVLVLGFLLGANIRQTFAKEEKVTFNSVVPFSTPGGFLAFFDRGDGTLYIYDDQMKQCVFKYRLTRLGQGAVDLMAE